MPDTTAFPGTDPALCPDCASIRTALRGKTTQIHKQASIRQLRQIHTATHPTQLPPAPANGTGQDAVELLATEAAQAEEDNEKE
jgi:hypothetical protein